MAQGKITIVGLGSGDKQDLTFEVWELLKTAECVYLRTEHHPVVASLKEAGLRFQTFDDVYERHTQFPSVYEEVCERILSVAKNRHVVYAVPGHPMVAEETTRRLIRHGKTLGIPVDVRGGRSFLDALFTRLSLDPIDGLLLLDGSTLEADQLNPRLQTVIAQVYDPLTASDVKLTLMEQYPDDWEIIIAHALGVTGQEDIIRKPLYALDHSFPVSSLSLIVVPPVPLDVVLTRDFNELTRIIATLRGPDGCPWDKAQTHASLRKYLVEETAEFIEAVNENDPFAMCEELGDVLLQVVLHARIATEQGTFTVRDVIETLADKMIRRHPHVFGGAEATDPEGVEREWERLKALEAPHKEHANPLLLEGIPETLPTLTRVETIQKRAADVGFDWTDIAPVAQKVKEELAECLEASSPDEREVEVGDLLFAVVNLARFLDVDPEQALRRAGQKFMTRFHKMQRAVERNGMKLHELTLQQLDAEWEKVKGQEKLS